MIKRGPHTTDSIASLVPMIDTGAMSPLVYALVVVGVIVVQAVGLYIGYGLVERIVSPRIAAFISET